MSPAHIHQYAASISPGQLSESLPSSQVNFSDTFLKKQTKFAKQTDTNQNLSLSNLN